MSKKSRENGNFVKLQYQVLDLVEYNGHKINSNMKILLSLILSYEDSDRIYYESVGTIGKRCGCRSGAVRDFRNKLCDAKMITFEEREGSSHKYSSLPFDKSLAVFIDDEGKVKPKQQRKEENKDNHGAEKQETIAVSAPVNSSEHEPAMENDSNANLSNSDELEIGGNTAQLLPWDGSSFLPSGKLAPNSRSWAQSQGAKDWKEEIRMVWHRSGVVVDDKTDVQLYEGRCPDDLLAQRKQTNVSLECVGYDDSEISF
ncbi:hypothetical protein ACMVR4_000647 [Yersinia enterocolitica]|nr:hypothetical protein [Yersinia enterocolitica]HED4488830.1 hypothetical protein [Yersinia enterocolitica]